MALASAVNLAIMPPEPKVTNIAYASPKSTLASSALVVSVIPDTPEKSLALNEKRGDEGKDEEGDGSTSGGIVGLENDNVAGIKGLIKQYFPKEPLMVKIADCESSLIQSAKNKKSSAKGILQIIDGTWEFFKCEGDVLNAKDNLKCGVKILEGQGLSAWQESFSCWKNF